MATQQVACRFIRAGCKYGLYQCALTGQYTDCAGLICRCECPEVRACHDRWQVPEYLRRGAVAALAALALTVSPVSADAGLTALAVPAPVSEALSLGVWRVTAYTDHDAGMDGRGITASGERTRWGVVAVDPTVIPLGTRLEIEGFEGEFVALDTGGGVRGEHVDVWHSSRAEALQHGVQWREVRQVVEVGE